LWSVLADAFVTQGNAVYAEIPNSLVAEKSSKIEVNKVYQLRRFKILPAKSLYKAVDAPVMIQFTIYAQADIVKNPPSTFPSFIHRLTTFEQIPSMVGTNERFIGKNCACIIYIHL
jgi:hypothetical protein